MSDTVEIARRLRKNQTDAEKLLWKHLRDRQLEHYKFRRQHPISPYVVDFFCEDKNFIVEVDGGQHSLEIDAKRTSFLETQGYKIVRFWNNEVLTNIEGVLTAILMEIKKPRAQPKAPHPNPSPEGRGAKVESLPKGEGEKRICLGKIVNAHGIKGLVKILPFGGEPRLIEELGPVYTSETGPSTLKITMKNSAGHKYWLASVEGVTERNGAEALRGTELYVARDLLPGTKDENTFYHADLIGLRAVDEDGQETGTVIAVQNFGAGDLLEIQPKGKDSFYLPFTKDTVLEITDDTITVLIPEGLL